MHFSPHHTIRTWDAVWNLRRLLFPNFSVFASVHTRWLCLFSRSLCNVGPQPATRGHLETLADLVDDWGMGDQGKIFWGDKGEGTVGARHAGTSGLQDRIGIIRMDSLNAG